MANPKISYSEFCKRYLNDNADGKLPEFSHTHFREIIKSLGTDYKPELVGLGSKLFSDSDTFRLSEIVAAITTGKKVLIAGEPPEDFVERVHLLFNLQVELKEVDIQLNSEYKYYTIKVCNPNGTIQPNP